MTGDPIWFTYHVPKTGGQTLRNHLRTELGPDAHVHLGRWGPEDAFVDVDVLERTRLADVRAITGHPLTARQAAHFGGRAVHEVLILREPGQRLVSHLNYRNWRRSLRGQPAVTFGEFARGEGRDPMTASVGRILGEERRRFRLDAILHAMTRLTVVSVLEDLDRVTPPLLSAMGLPPRLPVRSNRDGVDFPRSVTPSRDELDAWRRRNPEDMVLYMAARQLTERSMDRLADVRY